MNNLIIEETKSTPLVDFKEGVLLIKGQSYNENPRQFYSVIMEWLDNYFNEYKGETTFIMKFLYLNTSSTKIIMEIIRKLEKIYAKGIKIKIEWYYDEENENILETGEDFKEEAKLEFNIIVN